MMEFTRRIFNKGAASTALLAFTSALTSLVMTGCGVFSDILLWIPIGLTAIQGIVTVLGPLVSPGATAIIVLIKAAFADLSATITQYNNDTNPADKATLLAKIRTVLNDIVANFQSFLDSLNIGNNPIETVVIGLANVVLAAIAGFLGKLPAPVAGTKVMSTSFRMSGKMYTVVPKYYKRVGDFKTDYNAVCAADGHVEIEIH
jgi:hypothetical protein